MKIFMLISSCLLILMFVSALAGIKIAENGLEQMRGNDNSNIQSLEHTNLRTSVEDESNSHDINTKRKVLERMNTYNLFSFMGEELAEGISNASKKVIRLVVH